MKHLAAAALSLSLAGGGAAQAGEADSRSAAESLEAVAPALAAYARNELDGGLWQRPDLSPRDRSLVTVSALISAGQTGAFSFHLGKAMDNGLTRAEASEVLTQLAFYAGWPNVFAAMPVAKEVFEARAEE